jgi:hypothetical protein
MSDGAITSVSLNPNNSNALSITTEIDDDEIEDFYDFDLEVDDDSGPVEFLTRPAAPPRKNCLPGQRVRSLFRERS